MKLCSYLLALLCTLAVACSSQSDRTTQDPAFLEAIRDSSTSPYFVKLHITDLQSKRSFETCITANLFMGAVHIELDLPYTNEGIEAAEQFVANSNGHSFSFNSPAALANMPLHPTQSELSDAADLVADSDLSSLYSSLERGDLLDYYSGSAQSRQRMSAVACALIDRGLRPRMADFTGTLYLEHYAAT